MRTAFIKSLTEAAEKDPRVMLLVGDLGFGVVVDFAKKFPKQFLNVGVAEQNMAGVAAGLAMSGKNVFTYSIGNFPTLRCLEQIRSDICYHEAKVTSVCVGGGFCYGALGMSHHATEDIAVMRSLPNMSVFSPGDPLEAQAITEYLAQGKGPAYLRLGRAGEPMVHEQKIDWQPGKAVEVLSGKEVVILATGSMLHDSVAVARRLRAEHDVDAGVLSVPTLKPLDERDLLDRLQGVRQIVTIEEHSVIGGLGSAVADILCDNNVQIPFKRFGLPSEFAKLVGSQEYLRENYRLETTSLLGDILGLESVRHKKRELEDGMGTGIAPETYP